LEYTKKGTEVHMFFISIHDIDCVHYILSKYILKVLILDDC